MPDNFTDKNSYIKQIISGIFLFICGVGILYPFCRYYVDPDAAAYLVIIKRYASGDFVTAANGLWSPLHCWLSALLVRLAGFGYFNAALAVNCIGGLSVIMLSQYLFNRFRSGKTEQWCMAIFSGIYWAYIRIVLRSVIVRIVRSIRDRRSALLPSSGRRIFGC